MTITLSNECVAIAIHNCHEVLVYYKYRFLVPDYPLCTILLRKKGNLIGMNGNQVKTKTAPLFLNELLNLQHILRSPSTLISCMAMGIQLEQEHVCSLGQRSKVKQECVMTVLEGGC